MIQPKSFGTKKYSQIVIGISSCAILMIFILNFVVDPFNKNSLFEVDLPKSTISFKMNYQLYKILEYSKNPQPIILLGDSRANSLKKIMFSKAGVDNFYNFAYGGGSLYEAIDTFWFASKITKLKKVIIGLPFNLYSESNNINRLNQALAVSQSSSSYYFSSLVSKASIFNLLTRFTGKAFKTEKPKMSKERFWELQLSVTAANDYNSWRKPNLLYKKLVKLVEACDQNEIELIFLLPPTHVELQEKIMEHSLHKEYLSYKKELQALGNVIDFDFKNNLTKRKENFNDPYHFNSVVAQDIVNVIADTAKHDNQFFRILSKNSKALVSQ